MESCTGAVYHAFTTVLAPLDRLFDHLLEHLNISREIGFRRFNLLPFSTRRDIAMLGLIHKCVLGIAHPLLQDLFAQPALSGSFSHPTRFNRTLHGRQLKDHLIGAHSDQIHRSVFGLVKVYNRLPGYIVEHTEITAFQKGLMEILRDTCDRRENWADFLSPRRPIAGSL